MADSPPAQKVTNDDLTQAIQHQCQKSGIPVVPTKQVAKVDFIDIKKQAVARRLKSLADQEKISSLKIGRGWVWWVPDKAGAGGEADFSTIDWDSIDAKEIPAEKLEEHPELSGESYWNQLKEDGKAIARFGFYTLMLGFIVLFIDQNIGLISLTSFQEDVGVLSVVVGMFLLVLGFVAAGISKTATSIAEKGVNTWTENKYRAVKSRIHAGVPVRVSLEWKHKNEGRDEN